MSRLRSRHLLDAVRTPSGTVRRVDEVIRHVVTTRHSPESREPVSASTRSSALASYERATCRSLPPRPVL